MAKRSGIVFFDAITAALIVVVTFVVVALSVKTMVAVQRHAICVPE